MRSMWFRICKLISSVGWPLVSGLAYFIFATFALQMSHRASGVVALWPSSGIVVASLLLASPARRVWFLGCCIGSGFLAYLHSGMHLPIALGCTAANLAETAVATTLIRKIAHSSDSFYTPAAILRFGAASLLAAITNCIITTIFITWAGGEVPAIVMLSWLSITTLGIMVPVPLILNVAYELRNEGLKADHWKRDLGTLFFVAAITGAVFWQSSYPLLFLPLFAIVVATYVSGPNGAAGGIFLIAVMGTVGLSLGTGPISLIPDEQEAVGAVLFFQFYLLINILAALPLAAMLNKAARHTEAIAFGKRWLEMSERYARVGHWRLDLKENTLFWSDEVFRIHGLLPGAPPPLATGIDFYHPDDREPVRHCLEMAISARQPYERQARLIRADGELRYVHVRGELEVSPDGTPLALFGIFQDVTEAALSAMDMVHAREDAEQRMDEALQQALTDPLTGIANRRKIMEMLSNEVEIANRETSPLSLALLDVDHFKHINDLFGHAVGDLVLQRIARMCADAVREADLVGRFGGEEFVIVLPGANALTAMIVADRVRTSIENVIWQFDPNYAVTVSVGVTTNKYRADVEAMLRDADKALYRAKDAGRNRLHLAA